ncbi:WRKY transcription factor 72A-like isoform X1 [Populus alba x Populus x berolinensis]|nr:WRKY transcription factor 72A-like isoform X1 [Populus alba x Populus x berolinensis]
MIKMDVEDAMRRPHHEVVLTEDERVDSSGDEGSCREEAAAAAAAAAKVGSQRGCQENDDRRSSSPQHRDSGKQVVVATKKERTTMEADAKESSCQKEQDDQLESARAEMGEVRKENQRLKIYLDRMMKDYRTLQVQFYDIIQQEETKKSTDTVDDHDQGTEEQELVSLTLGRISSEPKRDGKNNRTSSQGKNHDEQAKESLSLGSLCTFEVSKSGTNETLPNPSPENSFGEPKEEAGETWPPGKVLKTMRGGDDEVPQQNPAKKARVSVRARCDTPTVQRCAEDMSILTTTYEGTHNHPLPISATAMASTTSAAASMLLSGSSSSPGTAGFNSSGNIAVDLHGLNYYLSDNSKSKQFYLHNSSLSSSSTYPTITLDLTSNPSSTSSHFNRFTTSSYRPTIQKFASTSLNFGSSDSSNAMPWGNGFLPTSGQSHNRINHLGALNIGRPAMDQSNIYDQFYMPKINDQAAAPSQQSLPADAIAAATKAITADPSFQSVLAAALTSIIGTGTGSSATGVPNLGVVNNLFPKSERGPVSDSFSSSPPHGNPCASYFNKTTSAINSQPAPSSMAMFVPPSLPFSTPTNASASPVDKNDRAN